MANETIRNERKTRIGVVVSNKMEKTIVVLLKTKAMHPIYGKLRQMTQKINAILEILLKLQKLVHLAKIRDGDSSELLKKLNNV